MTQSRKTNRHPTFKQSIESHVVVWCENNYPQLFGDSFKIHHFVKSWFREMTFEIVFSFSKTPEESRYSKRGMLLTEEAFEKEIMCEDLKAILARYFTPILEELKEYPLCFDQLEIGCVYEALSLITKEKQENLLIIKQEVSYPLQAVVYSEEGTINIIKKPLSHLVFKQIG